MSKLFSSVAPLSYALDFHLERHNLLAANLANVDTPRYKPLDLARLIAIPGPGTPPDVARRYARK